MTTTPRDLVAASPGHPAPGREVLRALAVALAVGAGCAAAVVLTGVLSHEAAPAVASFVVATSGLVGGVVVLARRSPPTARASRRWLAASALAWCGGEMVSVLLDVLLPGPPPRPNAGDALSLLAGPLAMTGVLRLPRPPGRSGALRTLSVDAVVLALGTAVAVWMAWFSSEGASSALVGFCVVVVLLYLLLLGLLAQVAMVGRDAGVVVLIAGLAALALGDLAVTRELVAGAAVWDWRLAAVQCFAWPVVLGGVDGVGRGALLGRRTGRTDEGESYAAVVTTAAVYVVWLVALGVFVATGADVVTAVLGLLAVVSAGLREVLRLRSRLRAVRRLSRQVRVDALTGLGSARALADAFDELAGDGGAASMVLLDLDGFAEVDERLGRTASDVVLVGVAEALARRFEEARTFRAGGDELVVLLACGPEEATSAADEARALVAAEAGARGLPALTASAGIAGVDAGPGRGPGTEGVPAARDVLAEATTAAASASRAGGDRTTCFRGAVAERLRRRALVERRLRRALAEDALHVELQPLVHLGTGRLKGFEVLSRWEDEVLGRVGPEEFVEVAEHAGLVPGVGRSAMRRGLAALRASGAVERGLTLSVNASPLELRDPAYPDLVLAALAAEDVPATALVVEVTESLLVEEDDPALGVMAALRAAGTRIAVDDVGSGYASLTYLARLPVDVVKVDRSLVAAMDDARTARVLEALVGLSRALGLVVLAEGVEEPWQVAPLAGYGVALGQGWLWSRALPVEALAPLVREDARRHPGPVPSSPPVPSSSPGQGVPATASARRPPALPAQRPKGEGAAAGVPGSTGARTEAGGPDGLRR
ncbi:bifunctional diguanylate cyclase/phosphodiesterase [Pseudokineococcus basanitobsidens]|uniref:Bifunctional diguanylate cyclase/phosphodiesterase n=1 Tax=Pseudokineococcus basanitobsidens TaxID=1926649 RepID=A0ABU8RI48_9ACTN